MAKNATSDPNAGMSAAQATQQATPPLGRRALSKTERKRRKLLRAIKSFAGLLDVTSSDNRGYVQTIRDAADQVLKMPSDTQESPSETAGA